MKDYYSILGINKNASKEEIRDSYRKLNLKYHPGQTNNDSYFTEKFTDINEAYETLIDNEERRKYDEKHFGKSNDNNKTNSSIENTVVNVSLGRTTNSLPSQNIERKKRRSKRWGTVLLIFLVIGIISRNLIQYNKIKNFQDVTISKQSSDNAAVLPGKHMLNTGELENAHDESTATKQETEEWIIDKIKKYTYDTTATDKELIVHVVKLHDIYFTNDNLVIALNDEFTSQDGIQSTNSDSLTIPVNNISSIAFPDNVMFFGTNKKTIRVKDEGKTEYLDLAFLPFTSSETDIARTMRKAFLHLQNLYDLPSRDTEQK